MDKPLEVAASGAIPPVVDLTNGISFPFLLGLSLVETQSSPILRNINNNIYIGLTVVVQHPFYNQ